MPMIRFMTYNMRILTVCWEWIVMVCDIGWWWSVICGYGICDIWYGICDMCYGICAVCMICFTWLMLMQSVHLMSLLMGDPPGSPLFLFMYTKSLSPTVESWYVHLMPMPMGDPSGSPLFLHSLELNLVPCWALLCLYNKGYVYVCDYKLMVMRVKVMPKDFQKGLRIRYGIVSWWLWDLRLFLKELRIMFMVKWW